MMAGAGWAMMAARLAHAYAFQLARGTGRESWGWHGIQCETCRTHWMPFYRAIVAKAEAQAGQRYIRL